MPLWFSSLSLFLPKPISGEPDSGSGGVRRSAQDTRPLGLKSTSNKVVAATLNRRITPAIQRVASVVQRGFVAKRNFVNNIVDLDSAARLAAVRAACHPSPPRGPPSLLSFDFAQAFPSVSQAWMKLTVKAYRMPRGFLLAVIAYCALNPCYYDLGMT
eukprot:4357321-Pyramimonas_sp.AAC.1